jgi:hypothetical protein
VCVLVAQRDATVAAPSSAGMYEIGTLGVMIEWLRQPDGTMKTLIEGKKSARVTRYVFDEEFFKAEAEEIEEPGGRSAKLEGFGGFVPPGQLAGDRLPKKTTDRTLPSTTWRKRGQGLLLLYEAPWRNTHRSHGQPLSIK